jgi:uncharacterized protein with ParB-like and HNH nuclease domain/predicted transport protein
MKAVEANFLEFLKKSQQFAIPLYQRTYSWTETECRQLWDDILRTGSNDEISGHFVGSVVYIESGLYQISAHAPLLVIDGQQRLTTVSLILEALARHLGEAEPIDGFSAEKLRSYYLLNPLEKDERRFKLLLTQTDRETLLALVQQKSPPAEHSFRLEENFDFFESRIAALGDDLAALCYGLAKLMIVDISLNREQDNPQLIFESMNSTGRELSQADLIRNYVLMGLEPSLQTELYQDHWRPMELAFGQEAYGTHFDGFMRHYLTLKTGEIPKLREVYEAFKAHTREPEVTAAGVGALVADVQIFAEHYCAMALGREGDPQLGEAFQDLRELRVDVAYPFLLELYHDYCNDVLSRADLHEAVRLIEAYVFRRAVCSIPTNSLNKTFATFGRALDKGRYLESIKAHLLLMPSYRRFPSDEEFQRDFVLRDLYKFRNRSYWLRRLENHGRKERVSVDEYTIEHIMPQNENLSVQWRSELGPEWERVHGTWLHTPGNLTLSGYNSEYSDRPFTEKRDMNGGFSVSPLKMNEGLGSLQSWNEAAIQERAARLSKIATDVWADPTLPPDVLATYRPKRERSLAAGYSIEDHPHLAAGSPMRPLFETLRGEVAVLDPVVTEEFLKLYVAYKAETNFVDVVPQAARLLLSLKIPFHELHDPRALARDVTNMGRWGNGDAEIGLSAEDELPYVMGLVRQAFEKQMGNGESGE